MMIKFLAHGAGICKRAADYLMGTHDHNGDERAEVRTLRGDAYRTALVADSLSFKWRYSSAVIAWAREDAPTDSDIDAVLNDFDRVAFAGMEPDEYSRAAVLHVDDDGARHVHVLIARTDLATGRAYNPAPPGWQRSFDPLRDMYNYERGWSRPDDPARRRPVQLTRAEMHDLLERGREKEMITTLLMDGVMAGRIRDRAGVVAALEEMPVITEITRVSKNFISVRVPGHEKPLRLKGPIYGADFDPTIADELIADAQAAQHGLLEPSGEPDPDPDPEKAEIARSEMEAAIQKRAEQFQKSHRRVKPEPAPEPAPTPIRARKPKPEVIDDGDRKIISRLAEAVGSAIHRARATIRSAFERFDFALGGHDRATERYDEQLSELVAADQDLIEASRRYEQRQREREEADLDRAMNRDPKPGPGSSGPGM